MRAIVTLVVLILLFPVVAAGPPGPDIEMFTREGCPFCTAALASTTSRTCSTTG